MVGAGRGRGSARTGQYTCPPSWTLHGRCVWGVLGGPAGWGLGGEGLSDSFGWGLRKCHSRIHTRRVKGQRGKGQREEVWKKGTRSVNTKPETLSNRITLKRCHFMPLSHINVTNPKAKDCQQEAPWVSFYKQIICLLAHRLQATGACLKCLFVLWK